MFHIKHSLCTLLREFIFISNQDMLKKSEDNRKSGSPDDISPDQEGPVQQGFPRGQVYYASSAKQVRILQTSSKINAKRSWCRMYLARIFFYRICYFVDKWCAKYCLFWHCQILFHWIYVSNGIYYRFGDFKMQLSSSIRVSIMKDFLKFIRSLNMKIEYAIF